MHPTLERIVRQLREAVAQGKSVGGAELDAREWEALLREIVPTWPIIAMVGLPPPAARA